MEQTVYLGSGSTSDIIVYVQSISSAGSHVALVVDTSTTKLVFASGSQSSVVPSVTSLGTGKAKITFASVTNSGNLAAGDTVAVKVNGTADGSAFSEYLIPVFIDSAGGGGGGLDAAQTRAALGLASANLDTQLSTIDSVVDAVLIDTGTDIPASIAALNDFDPASDTVTVGTNNDKSGYTISGTKTTLDSLNDVAATDIVSAGAITTLNGAVANVDLVDVTTTNTDQRGTDNAILAASAPSNWGSLLINGSGHITRVTLVDTTTTNTDMVDVSSLATSADLATVDGNVDAIKLKTDQLTFTVSNQVDANALTGGGGDDSATIYSYFTASNREDVFHADVSALSTSAEIAALNDISVNDVWDASLSSHNVGGSTGKALRQIKEGVISIDGSVNDTSATSTQFISSLSSSVDGYYHDKVIVFISGSLLGQARHIETYTGSTKSITVSQAFTSAPSNGDEFLILATHEHSLNEISEAVWSDTQSSYTVDGTFGYYLDSQVSQAGAGDDAATIYSYFTASNREDQFKSDVSGLASQSSVNTVDSNVDAIKAKTDELSFTIANQVDANAVTGGGTPIGAGAIAHTVTVNVGGNPADGVEVWVSTDSAGNNVVAGTLVTDAFGNATFMLEAGSYYLWAQRSGTNFTNPTSFSVS